MAQLRSDYKKFLEKETQIIIVGPEDRNKFAEYWKTTQIPFIGLPDPNHVVLKKFGQEVNIFKLGRMPAQVIIDKKGIVRYAHYGHTMSDIPANQEIFDIIDELNK